MRLRTVSLTGADHTVKALDVVKLGEKYPFAEWALLIARNKQGIANRYPTLKWLGEFAEHHHKVKRAVHICGGWARGALNGDTSVIDGARFMAGPFARMQLNVSPYLAEANMAPLRDFCHVADRSLIQVIVQTASPGQECILELSHLCGGRHWFTVLDDKSGGMGVRGDKFETPPFYRMSGFAGGLNPNNVVEVIEEIQALDFDLDYWLDMESGIRTGEGRSVSDGGEIIEATDRFDLDKCEAVLQACAPYVVK